MPLPAPPVMRNLPFTHSPPLLFSLAPRERKREIDISSAETVKAAVSFIGLPCWQIVDKFLHLYPTSNEQDKQSTTDYS